jgi:tetratricopeptide (TPR) repeat protein
VKQFLLILLLLIFTKSGYAQAPVTNDAFSAYQLGNYKFAIERYQKRIAQNSMPYDMYMLAMCYIKTDSVPRAKQELEKLITFNDKYSEHINVEGCNQLAGIYLKEKNYRKALDYYKLYALMFKNAKFNDINWFRFNFFNAGIEARCYDALGLADSAIMVMTPYMFNTHDALNRFMFVVEGDHDLADSLPHDSLSLFYVSLLQKRYTNKSIKAEFKRAEKNIVFIKKRSSMNQYGDITESMQCATDIYGKHLIFAESSIADDKDDLQKETATPFYTQKYQLKRFHNLPVCRMVRDLPE